MPLEEIARRAGVGIGTFYRHFPTREALVVAVYRQQIDDLAAAARELPLVHPPADALREWMHAFVDYAAVKRGMVALLKSMMETDSAPVRRRQGHPVNAAAGSLLTAAAEAGEIRAGLGPTELIRAIGGICMATDRPGLGRDRDRPGGPGLRRTPLRRAGPSRSSVPGRSAASVSAH